MIKHLLPILLLCVTMPSRGISTCKLRVYLTKAEQIDDNGLRCWDTVKVPACSGRCDSREISDWKFPFKKSYHPVCMHGSRRSLTTRLRNCDRGVATGSDIYHYVAAEDCRCKLCSSKFTSCEWLPPNSSLSRLIDNAFEDIDDANYY